MNPRRAAEYNLSIVQEMIEAKRVSISRVAADGARDLYLDSSDILSCVASLTDRDFYKTMPSETFAGLWQDVYKCRYCGFAVYIKLQIARIAPGSDVEKVAVISFKQDESA